MKPRSASRIRSFSITGLFLLAVAGSARAQTIWTLTPDPEDCPDGHCTIQDAVDDPNVLDGDILELANGIYEGAVNLGDKNLVIRSRSGDPTTCVIDDQGGTWSYIGESSTIAVEILDVGFHRADPFIWSLSVGGSGALRLRGCRFETDSEIPPDQEGGDVGISASVAAELTDCEFVGSQGSETVSQMAVYAQGAITAEGCTVRGYAQGLQVGPGSVIRSCTFESNRFPATGLNIEAALRLQDGLVESCLFSDNWVAIGALIESGQTLTISDCQFLRNTHQAVDAYVDQGTLEILQGCAFEENSAGGPSAIGGAVSIRGSGSARIEGATFEANQGAVGALAMTNDLDEGSGTLDVEACRFVRNTGDPDGAVRTLNVRAVDVRGTVMAENLGSALVCAGNVPGVSASIGGSTFAHNQGAGILAAGTTKLSISHCISAFNTGGGLWSVLGCPDAGAVTCTNLFGNGENWESPCLSQHLNDPTAGNLEADPLFCLATSLDYSLAANSPCLPANNESCSVVIGAMDQGCPPTRTSVSSWGSLKATFSDPR